MSQSFPDTYKQIAEEMGISLYQRFSITEAALFLRCQASHIDQLMRDGKLGFIEISDTEKQFFGYQLLEHVLESITEKQSASSNANIQPERIIRAKEVSELTGLSRTTIWRMERKGQFPARVSLGVGSVGWRYSEVNEWLIRRDQVL